MTVIDSEGVSSETGQRNRSRAIAGLVYGIVLLYILFFSWLSIQRHRTFQSNAMDLGYTDQVVWNTLHGRFLQFSTYQNAPIDLPLDQFRRTDVLLAYHVELLLVPISLLYLVYDSPLTLLVLQAVVVGLGALPAFWLARDHLQSDWAGLVFALAYLLAPAVGGALLSDFHAVTLTASLLLFAFYFVRARRYVLYFGSIILAILAKEDVPLLVFMLGLYLVVFGKERWVGVLTALIGAGWFLVATQVIQPFYHGLPTSPFFHRITVFGPTIVDSLANVIRDPMLVWRWLRQPEIVTYLVGLLASAGFMSLFSPIVAGLSAPVMAINVFSTWDWTHSEGAHYSASVLPWLIISGIYGLGFLARQVSRRTQISYQRAVNALAAVVLLVAGYHHYQIGISPLSRSYHPPRVTAHHRLAGELMALIPPDAALSAQSGLYPHLAHRQEAYFFPAVNDAEYVFLDVTGPSFPITLKEVYVTMQRLLDSGEYGVLAARDGYVLLQRGTAQEHGTTLPDAFYSFARVDSHPRMDEQAVPYPLRAQFGDKLELLGYDYTLHNAVHAQQLPATVTTYWRVLESLDDGLAPVLFFSRRDGAIVYHYDGETPTALWYPPDLWQEGEVIRIQTPILSVGRLRETMLAVVPATGDPWSVADRLPAGLGQDSVAGDEPLETYEEGTLLPLFRFP
jgi:uncharacterized membrane protein